MKCNSAGRISILKLGGCNLQGSIPANAAGKSVFSLSALTEFHAEQAGEGALCNTRQGIRGPLPIDLKDATHLQVLGLYCNTFTGPLTGLASLAQLVQVDVHFNFFSGLLPSLTKSKATLTYVSVANNQLTGSVPAEYAHLSQLTTFGVAFNKLNGPLDAVVNALSKLVVIYVRDNAFTGTLPLPGPHVAVYDADHNKFSKIPANICTGTLPGKLIQ